MTDETTMQQPNDGPQDEGTPTDSRTVPYQRFKSVNDKYRALEREAADLRTQLATPADSDWQAKHDALAAELDGMKLARLKDRIVHAKGLPLDLADRLHGSTEADLTEDLDRLMALGFAPTARRAPNIGATDQGASVPTYTTRQVADPIFYAAHRDDILAAQREGRIRS